MRKSSSSVSAYLLVLAILYPSADAALNALCGARDGTYKPVSVQQRYPSSILPGDEELMELYVMARGSYAAMLLELNVPRHRLQAKLTSLGLPNLACGKNEDRVRALTAFYVQKKPLAECLSSAGMVTRQLENLIRQCGPNVTRLLAKMEPPRGRRSLSRKGKTLLPRQERAAHSAEHVYIARG